MGRGAGGAAGSSMCAAAAEAAASVTDVSGDDDNQSVLSADSRRDAHEPDARSRLTITRGATESGYLRWQYDPASRIFFVQLGDSPSSNEDADALATAHVSAITAHRIMLRAAQGQVVDAASLGEWDGEERSPIGLGMHVIYDLRGLSGLGALRSAAYASRLASGLTPLVPQFGSFFTAQAVVMQAGSVLGTVLSAVLKLVEPAVPLRVFHDVEQASRWCADVASPSPDDRGRDADT